MIAFAELLERLVFTPSRNAKIALLRRYFSTQPDPGPRHRPRRHHRRAFLHRRQARPDPRTRSGAHRSRAVRLVVRLRRRPRGDGRPDVARRADQRATAASRRGGRSTGDRAQIRAARDRRCAGSTPPIASVRLALLKLITGGLRVGASTRLAKIALAEIGGVQADDVEEVWHGLAPALPAAVRLAGEARPAPRSSASAGVPSAHAGASAGSRRHRRTPTRPTGAPSGNGTASASSSSQPRAAAGSTRAAPRTSPAPSRKSSRQWTSTPCSTANCWSCATARSRPSPTCNSA